MSSEYEVITYILISLDSTPVFQIVGQSFENHFLFFINFAKIYPNALLWESDHSHKDSFGNIFSLIRV